MKHDDIMKLVNMDYDDLVKLTQKDNLNELQNIVTTLSKTANRRIRRLKEDPIGAFSPALQRALRGGKKNLTFKHAKGGNLHNELLEHFGKVKKFLNSKTSTLKGWKQVRSNVASYTDSPQLFQKTYKSKGSASRWLAREKRFWQLYNKLVDDYGGIISQLDSKRIQKMLLQLENKEKHLISKQEAIQEAMEKYITELYEGLQSGTIDTYEQIDELEQEFLM